MFSQVLTWSGAVLGLLVLVIMVVSGPLVDSEQRSADAWRIGVRKR